MKDAIKGIFSRMIGSPKTLSPASSKQDLRQSPTKSLSGGQLLSLPTKGLIFGRKLTELPSDDDHIPFILKDFVEYIENKSGAVESTGIYRVAGSFSYKRDLRSRLDTNGHVDFAEEDPANMEAILACFKEFIRDIAGGLVPKDFIQPLLTVQDDVEKLFETIETIPTPNKECLEYLIEHLLYVSSKESLNRMSNSNLAKIFSMNVFSAMDLNPSATGSAASSSSSLPDMNQIKELGRMGALGGLIEMQMSSMLTSLLFKILEAYKSLDDVEEAPKEIVEEIVKEEKVVSVEETEESSESGDDDDDDDEEEDSEEEESEEELSEESERDQHQARKKETLKVTFTPNQLTTTDLHESPPTKMDSAKVLSPSSPVKLPTNNRKVSVSSSTSTSNGEESSSKEQTSGGNTPDKISPSPSQKDFITDVISGTVENILFQQEVEPITPSAIQALVKKTKSLSSLNLKQHLSQESLGKAAYQNAIDEFMKIISSRQNSSASLAGSQSNEESVQEVPEDKFDSTPIFANTSVEEKVVVEAKVEEKKAPEVKPEPVLVKEEPKPIVIAKPTTPTPAPVLEALPTPTTQLLTSPNRPPKRVRPPTITKRPSQSRLNPNYVLMPIEELEAFIPSSRTKVSELDAKQVKKLKSLCRDLWILLKSYSNSLKQSEYVSTETRLDYEMRKAIYQRLKAYLTNGTITTEAAKALEYATFFTNLLNNSLNDSSELSNHPVFTRLGEQLFQSYSHLRNKKSSLSIDSMTPEQLSQELEIVSTELRNLNSRRKINEYEVSKEEDMKALHKLYEFYELIKEKLNEEDMNDENTKPPVNVSDSMASLDAAIGKDVKTMRRERFVQEKKIIQLRILDFKKDFVNTYGREPKTKEDKSAIVSDLKRYKQLKSLLTV